MHVNWGLCDWSSHNPHFLDRDPNVKTLRAVQLPRIYISGVVSQETWKEQDTCEKGEEELDPLLVRR